MKLLCYVTDYQTTQKRPPHNENGLFLQFYQNFNAYPIFEMASINASTEAVTISVLAEKP
jgi:hypothetical protein